MKEIEADIQAKIKGVNEAAGIKESDTGLAIPALWDLAADKQALQTEEPLQVRFRGTRREGGGRERGGGGRGTEREREGEGETERRRGRGKKRGTEREGERERVCGILHSFYDLSLDVVNGMC